MDGGTTGQRVVANNLKPKGAEATRGAGTLIVHRDDRTRNREDDV